MAGQCPVHPPTHPHVTLGRDAQGLGVGADSMEEKDAMKSYHNKSMAGICMHKTILALSLKSNWVFGKRSPIHGQRDARLMPAGGAKEEREGHSQITAQSQLEPNQREETTFTQGSLEPYNRHMVDRWPGDTT